MPNEEIDGVPVWYDHAAAMIDLFPDCRLAVLPGTKHTEVMQRSEQLRALVGPFLA